MHRCSVVCEKPEECYLQSFVKNLKSIFNRLRIHKYSYHHKSFFTCQWHGNKKRGYSQFFVAVVLPGHHMCSPRFILLPMMSLPFVRVLAWSESFSIKEQIAKLLQIELSSMEPVFLNIKVCESAQKCCFSKSKKVPVKCALIFNSIWCIFLNFLNFSMKTLVKIYLFFLWSNLSKLNYLVFKSWN